MNCCYNTISDTTFEMTLKSSMEKIIKKLGYGYRESIYQNALAHELRNIGYNVKKEFNVSVFYENVEVGVVRLDLLIDDRYIIEFKAISKITDKEKNQLKRYLKLTANLSSYENEGYLINVSFKEFEIQKFSFR